MTAPACKPPLGPFSAALGTVLRTVVVRNPVRIAIPLSSCLPGLDFIPNNISTGKGSLNGGPFWFEVEYCGHAGISSPSNPMAVRA
ncbi:hypothetical protein ACVWXO_004744 [Bradyrhizobium sp. LM2.7]